MTYELAPYCIIEQVGDEILICDPSREVALQVTGTTADVFRQFQATGSLDGAEPESIVSLVNAGILLPVGQQGLLGRRALITAGAGVVGLGIVALALPNAAAASSPGPNPDPPDPDPPDPDPPPAPPNSEPEALQPSTSGSTRFIIDWFEGATSVPYDWVLFSAVPASPSPVPTSGSGVGTTSFIQSTWGIGQRLNIDVTSKLPFGAKTVRVRVTRPLPDPDDD